MPAQIPARRQQYSQEDPEMTTAPSVTVPDIMNARDRSWQSRDETHQRASPLRSVILKEGARPLARAGRARSAR